MAASFVSVQREEPFHQGIADASNVLQHDADLLFAIFAQLSDVESGSLKAALQVSTTWRAVGLRPDLCHWHECSHAKFVAFDGLARPALEGRAESIASLVESLRISALARPLHLNWTCEAVARLAVAKPRLVALDLTGCFVSDASAAAQMSACLPPTLECLIVSRAVNQPDAMLHQLLRGLEALPRLRELDLRGIFNERTLAGVRLLARGGNSGVNSAVDMARTLPALEVLAIGFNAHTPLGRREGSQYLAAQASRSPRLRCIGCSVEAASLKPIDVYCRECGGLIYADLHCYIAHAPQQKQIAYEIHTDTAPIAAAVEQIGGDPTRLFCARHCQGNLWLVDGGSPYVKHVLGRRFSVACGPASHRDASGPFAAGPFAAGTHTAFGLAIAVPAGSGRAPGSSPMDGSRPVPAPGDVWSTASGRWISTEESDAFLHSFVSSRAHTVC